MSVQCFKNNLPLPRWNLIKKLTWPLFIESTFHWGEGNILTKIVFLHLFFFCGNFPKFYPLPAAPVINSKSLPMGKRSRVDGWFSCQKETKFEKHRKNCETTKNEVIILSKARLKMEERPNIALQFFPKIYFRFQENNNQQSQGSKELRLWKPSKAKTKETIPKNRFQQYSNFHSQSGLSRLDWSRLPGFLQKQNISAVMKEKKKFF